MWMNLDALPTGKSMYTVHVTCDPEGTDRSKMSAEEVDVVAPSRATWNEVVNQAASELVEMYGPDSRVVGVVNQTDGFVMYDAFKAGDETGKDDM